jgi:hypothetical protein
MTEIQEFAHHVCTDLFQYKEHELEGEKEHIVAFLSKLSPADFQLVKDVTAEFEAKIPALEQFQDLSHKSDQEMGKVLMKEVLMWVVLNPIKVGRLAHAAYKAL